MKKKPYQNICPYCGEVRSATKEHLFGKWTTKHFPELSIHNEHTLRRPGQEDIIKSRRQGGLRSLQIKGPCEPCNNRWMSKIQEDAKPHLIRLGDGEFWQLQKNEKLAISNYFVMLTMTWELRDSNTMATTPSERKQFMNSGRPGKNWRVLISKHNSKSWKEKLRHTGFGVFLPKNDKLAPKPVCNSQLTVSTLGELVFCTLSMPSELQNNLKHLSQKLADKFGFQTIWPLKTSTTEQPARILTEADLNSLDSFFYRPNSNGPIKLTEF